MLEPDEVARLDATLAHALPAGSLYAVGGRVRDELRTKLDGIARRVKDLDYVATGVSLEDLIERLRRIGRADVVGASFAVVKCTLDGITVDVALPRREHSVGAGHREFVIDASGPSVTLEEDLGRRDFRMNMLARALPSGDVVDPFGGADNVRARRVDVLRAEAFDEDPLRMLRACQFAARFDFVITPTTLDAIRAAAPAVNTVSAERIRDEFLKMLDAERPSAGLEWMRTGGLLEHVFPEIAAGFGVDQNEWHAHDVYYHGLATLDAAPAGDHTLRLAALFHDVAKPQTKNGPHFYRHEIVGEEVTREVLGRLRFPLDQTETVAALVRAHMFAADPELAPSTIRRFVRRVGVERLERLFALRQADIAGSGLPKRDDHNERFVEAVERVLSERPPLSVKDLAVNGLDAIAALVGAGRLAPASSGGPAVGRLLHRALEAVLEDPSRNDAQTLRPLLHDWAAEEPAG